MAYFTGTHDRVATDALQDGERRLLVRAGSNLDLFLADDFYGPTRAAFVRSVAPGSSVDARLQPTQQLSGRLFSEPPDGAAVVLAGPAGTFPVDTSGPYFSAAVLPGTYELILVKHGGEEQVLASELVSGRTDYEIGLR